jgi:hypothetical protein
MAQFVISDKSLPDIHIVSKLYDISTTKKISKVIKQNEDIIITYEEKTSINFNLNENRNIVVIPDKLYIKEKDQIYVTDNLKVPLKYFPSVIDIIVNKFPHIEAFLKDEKIFHVNIKPCIRVTKTNYHRVEEELNDYQKTIIFLENSENQEHLETYILAEIIRKLYRGEHDLMNGFLINRSTFKFLKLIVGEKTKIEMLMNKLDENPNVIDVDNFFYGSNGKFYMRILGNIIFYTPKKNIYFNFLDLKYLSILETLGNLLKDSKFGRN